MNRLVTLAFACLVFLAAATATAQSRHSPATLVLSVDPAVVKVGVPVFLEAVFTNQSDRNMAIRTGYTGDFDFSMEIDIRDEKGNPPPETKLFRCAQGVEVCPAANGGTLVFLGNLGSKGVSPHQSFRSIAELNRRYDLGPGHYTAVVKYQAMVQRDAGEDPDLTVESNRVSFTVVPN